MPPSEADVLAQVTGVFCRVVSESQPALAEFRLTMDDLNSFIRQRRLPRELQWRLREYFHKTRHLIHSAHSNQLLQKMSPSLQGEVLWIVNHVWLRRIRFLRGCEPEFIARTLLSLRPLVFAPGDVAFGNSLYVLHRGFAIYGGRVLGSGGVWGEDMLLTNARLRLRFYARALNYVEAFSIDRETLMEVGCAHARARRQDTCPRARTHAYAPPRAHRCLHTHACSTHACPLHAHTQVGSHFPDTQLRIRSYIGLLALRRAIVLIAREELHQRQKLGIATRSPYLVQFFAGIKPAGGGASGQSSNPLLVQTSPRRAAEAGASSWTPGEIAEIATSWTPMPHAKTACDNSGSVLASLGMSDGGAHGSGSSKNGPHAAASTCAEPDGTPPSGGTATPPRAAGDGSSPKIVASRNGRQLAASAPPETLHDLLGQRTATDGTLAAGAAAVPVEKPRRRRRQRVEGDDGAVTLPQGQAAGLPAPADSAGITESLRELHAEMRDQRRVLDSLVTMLSRREAGGSSKVGGGSPAAGSSKAIGGGSAPTATTPPAVASNGREQRARSRRNQPPKASVESSASLAVSRPPPRRRWGADGDLIEFDA